MTSMSFAHHQSDLRRKGVDSFTTDYWKYLKQKVTKKYEETIIWYEYNPTKQLIFYPEINGLKNYSEIL